MPLRLTIAIAALAMTLAIGPGGAAEAIPKPKARPSPAAGQDAAPPPSPPAQWADAAIAEARADCARRFVARDITYRPLEPIGAPGACGAPAPVEVAAVAGVKLAPPATLTCGMAEALHDWISAAVIPAAKARLGTELATIRTAASYACRRRNNSLSGKMSEHSRANALDMAGFTFTAAGKGLAVGGGNWGEGLAPAQGPSREGSFMEEIRRQACTHFTTVLGPGSDPHHGDHFHVDVLQRKGGYRICQ